MREARGDNLIKLILSKGLTGSGQQHIPPAPLFTDRIARFPLPIERLINI